MLLYGALFSLYCLARFATLERAISRYGDTPSYHRAASEPLLSHAFLVGHRAPTVPLVWKLLGNEETAITWAQFAISIACWFFFATSVASVVRHVRLRVVVLGLVLLFSLSAQIAQWDRDLLSESLTVSLTTLLYGLVLRLVVRPRRSTGVATLVFLALWIFARDQNAWTALVGLPVLLASLRFTRAKGAVIAATVVYASVAAASVLSAQAAHRADPSLVDVVDGRLFVDDPSARSWMIEHGYTGKTWANTTSTYRSFLVAHPVFTLTGPLRNRPSYSTGPTSTNRLRALYTPHTETYEKSSPRWRLPPLIERAAVPTRPAYLLGEVVVALALAAGAWFGRRPPRVALVPLLAAVAMYPQFVLVWNGDQVEVDRHALIPALTLRMSLIVVAALAADSLLRRRDTQRARVRPPRPRSPNGRP